VEEILANFADPQIGLQIIKSIRRYAGQADRKLNFMEVCGTHTMEYSSSGLRDILSDVVHLRSGPGCPVCVTSGYDINRMIKLARERGVISCTFGDMMRVPGSSSSLSEEKTAGANVRIVYSPIEALEVARDNPDHPVVFYGVGFETTVPSIALALKRAHEESLDNFYVLSVQKVLPPALEKLLSDPDLNIDGLILPGHVATVVGKKEFGFIADKYDMPAVVTGFEPLDLLYGLDCLLQMIIRGENSVKNAYTRAVKEEGNTEAKRIMEQFFYRTDAHWRGLGLVRRSGLRLRSRWDEFDASPMIKQQVPEHQSYEQCKCGDILVGKANPPDCDLFAVQCEPSNPYGPCMVSSEGACAAHFRYGRGETEDV